MKVKPEWSRYVGKQVQVIVVSSSPLPTEKTGFKRRVVVPKDPSAPKKPNFPSHKWKTQYQTGGIPRCVVPQCRRVLPKDAVLVCNDRCRDRALQQAQAVIDILTGPPKEGTVYADIFKVRKLHGRRKPKNQCGGTDGVGDGGGSGEAG